MVQLLCEHVLSPVEGFQVQSFASLALASAEEDEVSGTVTESGWRWEGMFYLQVEAFGECVGCVSDGEVCEDGSESHVEDECDVRVIVRGCISECMQTWKVCAE